MNKILDQLNAVQSEAVTTTEGPVLVIAGAGSGKTRVLTYKIAWLIEKGIPAWNILALTFTNKAAREMKERIEKLTNPAVSRNLWMGTFHSLFARILRKESESIGYTKDFTIYDSDDTRSLIRSILHDMKLDDQVYQPAEIQRRISNAKNQLITAEAYQSRSEWISADVSARRPEMAAVYLAYGRRCRNAGAMDFDDLLVNTQQLFKNHPGILQKYRDQFRYVLVDEYQDTNYVQYSIVNQIAGVHHNICVVGDDSQSIYSFRGARIENILNFRNDYPEYKMFKLEQNYRSTQTIVEAANSLIVKNQGRIPKNVFSANEPGEPIDIVQTLTDQEEGFVISNRILDTHLRQQADFREFAVLYRTHAQSRVIEEACRKQNIPYKIYGSISFYQRKEIKDVLAYFRLILNHRDDESFRRILNFPARGIGKTSSDRIAEAANQAQVPLFSVIGDPASYVPQFNRGTVDKLLQFRRMIEGFSELAGTADAYELAMKVLQGSGLIAEFQYDRTPEGISKFENIQELFNGIREFVVSAREESNDAGLTGMDSFLQNVSLLTDQDNEKPEDWNKVSLMTVHSAKGLEFSYVIIAGMEEDLFPSQFSTGTAKEVEEERRLFYVAITRAMKRVLITHSKTRFRWGSQVDCRPSRFIREIDQRFLRMSGNQRQASALMVDEEEEIQGPALIRPPMRRTLSVTNSALPPSRSAVDFEPDDPDSIQTGMTVIHTRFGNGKVLQIEGDGTSRKATVFFKDHGHKQLLLKFARLKINKS